VDTTEDSSVSFDAVTNDPAVAMRANRRQCMDRAFEAVEGVTLSAHYDFKRLVVFVFANFACRHTQIRSHERRLMAVFISSCERN
jgi:hypothetical protein